MHFLDATVTDLKSARAVIRIKRTIYPKNTSKQKITVPLPIYYHIQEQLRTRRQSVWVYRFFTGFNVDGRSARMDWPNADTWA